MPPHCYPPPPQISNLPPSLPCITAALHIITENNHSILWDMSTAWEHDKCLDTFLGPFRLSSTRGHTITTWTRWGGGGRGSKNVCFCPRSGCKNCPRKGGGSKICPRSYWMPPYPTTIVFQRTPFLHKVEVGTFIIL